ncbi:MAG: C40 family peptidase [Lachnospiraceae bacterium]
MGAIIESAVNWAIEIANDDTYGYVYGADGPYNFDCSGFACKAYSQAGLPITRVSTSGMKAEFVKNGFTDVASEVNTSTGDGLVRGDVLVNPGTHAVIYIGDGKIVHASNVKNGILVANFYINSWSVVLRYEESEGEYDMVCMYKITGGDGTVYYYDGAKLFALGDINEYNLLRTIYKSNTGKDMDVLAFTKDQHTHLNNVLKKRGI